MALQYTLYMCFIFLLNLILIVAGVLSPVGISNAIVFSASRICDTIFVLIQVFAKPFIRQNVEKEEEGNDDDDGGDENKDQKKIKNNKHKIRRVLCVVPTYKEETEEVTATLDSLIAQEENGVLVKRILIVCDGYIRYAEIFSSMAFIDTIEYNTYKQNANKLSLFYCTYKNCTQIVLMFKHENAGKKDSLTLVDGIFIDSLFNGIRDILLKLFNISEFQYIFHTDADSVLSANTLRRQSKIMEENSNISGVTGIVLVPQKYRFWSLFQGFQYFYGQLIRRMTQSMWGKPTCMPGCTNMVNITHDCIIEASTRYKKLPSKSHIFQVKNRLQGTDRRYTNCILQYSSSVRLVMDYEAKCYTIPPQSFEHFRSQRKRWTANSITGNFFLLFGSNIPWFVRFFSAIELFSIHTCVARLVSTFILLAYARELHLVKMMVMASLIVVPYSFFLYHAARLSKYGVFLVVGSLVSKFVSSFITVFNFLYCVYHFNDHSWGITHGVVNKDDSPAEELDTQTPNEILKKLHRHIETLV